MTRVRHAARILIVDPDDRILLFRFAHAHGPLAGVEYWGVPGGGVEPGESYAAAACRELTEETGIRLDDPGPKRAESSYPFRLSSGEEVAAHDHYFVLRLPERPNLSRSGFTPEERENMVEHRWWSAAEVADTDEKVIPGDLGGVLDRAGLVELRAAEPRDLPAILELQYLAYRSEAELLGNFEIPPLKETMADLERLLRRGALFLKAVSGGKEIVGSVRGMARDGTLHIGKLMVHPRWRGRGIGSGLVRKIEKLRPGMRYELFTSDKSARNIGLYERLGYRRFRECKAGPGLRFVYLEKNA